MTARVAPQPAENQERLQRRRSRTPSASALVAELHFLRALSLLFFVVALVALLALRMGGCRGPARAILVNDETVCYVRDERAAEEVRRRIVSQALGDLTAEAGIEERWEVVRPKTVSVDEAVELLTGLVHVQVEAVGIEVEGTVLVCVPTETQAEQALQLVKQHYTPQGERLLEQPKFRQKVRLVPQTVRPQEVTRDVEKAAEKLIASGGERIYTVKRGDNPSKIAQAFGMSVQELFRLNPGLRGRDLKVGETVKVSSDKPLLTVVTVRELKVRKPVPPPEQVVETDSLPRGEKRVVREGEPGEKVLTLRAVFENDKRVKAQTLDERVIKQPEARRVMVGTREPAVAAPSPEAPVD